jgi:hypothetical protein
VEITPLNSIGDHRNNVVVITLTCEIRWGMQIFFSWTGRSEGSRRFPKNGLYGSRIGRYRGGTQGGNTSMN